MAEFRCHNCGECCGPIPISKAEFEAISKAIRGMPPEKREALKAQARSDLTCILHDTESKACSVYEARPEICRMFGHYKGLACHKNYSTATGSVTEGKKRLKDATDNFIGILGLTISWQDLERGEPLMRLARETAD